MAAVGDSITQAASTDRLDAPQNSWSTGTSASVNSHYLRLLALGAPISGNGLQPLGERREDGRPRRADAGRATLQPDYLTVLIGGNDLCTDTSAR